MRKNFDNLKLSNVKKKATHLMFILTIIMGASQGEEVGGLVHAAWVARHPCQRPPQEIVSAPAKHCPSGIMLKGTVV